MASKEKRGPNTWRLVVSSSEYGGKRKKYTKTVKCKNAREADRELAKFAAEVFNGAINQPSNMTVSELCNLYMKEYAERFTKKSTIRSNASTIRTWIIPHIGDYKINKITRLAVQKWVNTIVDAGRSSKTVKNHFSVFQSIMKFALEMDLINKNPCENIKLPKQIKPESKFYNEEELQALIIALNSTDREDFNYKLCIYLALFGGLRKSEIMGLNWDDVDFSANVIHIHRTRQIAPAVGVYEDTTKTEMSARVVALPSFVIDELRDLKEFQEERKKLLKEEYKETNAVIRGTFGGAMYPQNLQRWFTRFCNKNNVPYYGLHALRHTHASILANMNIDKMQISRRLGHSQLSTTLNIYTHLFIDSDKQVANALSEFVPRLSPNDDDK